MMLSSFACDSVVVVELIVSSCVFAASSTFPVLLTFAVTLVGFLFWLPTADFTVSVPGPCTTCFGLGGNIWLLVIVEVVAWLDGP